MRRVARLGVVGGVGFSVIVALVACGYLALPFGWTVNFPGFSGDPQGFSIQPYAKGISNARFLMFTERGDLLVSAPRQGKVFLVARDADGDGRADDQRVLLDNLYQPHGLAYRDG